MQTMVPVLVRRVVLLGAIASPIGCTSLGDAGVQYAAGTVENAAGQPVPGALVRLQGTTTTVLSSGDGSYRLALRPDAGARHITAWKEGYYIGGALLASGGATHRIELKPLPSGDNPDYRWIPARAAAAAPSVKPCEACHVRDRFPVVREWESSAHARAATNPFFLAFYDGGGGNVPLLPRLGYRTDFPNSAGNCASCHVPALALRRPYDADPKYAEGVEREGVLCDLCHKVRQVNADLDGGRAGVLSIAFARPPAGEQVFLGPLDDVFPGPDTFNPLYRDSRYCAGCHHGMLWGVLAYGEFAEWRASAYAAKGIHCQNCHMKPDGRTRQVAVASEGAIRRDPATIASHAFPGRDDMAFMRSGLQFESTAQLESDGERLRVRVTLRNTGAGHHIPTGNPMRNLVLLIEARDGGGQELDLILGSRVPVWGGEGREDLGNYAGLPGKGYAKVLSTPVAYAADGRFDDTRAPIYPAPHWRRIAVESDNRIPAGGEDATEYVFRSTPGLKTADVRVRLWHRRSFRSWLDPQARPEGDLMLAEAAHTLQR